jgi:hypothetical protein
MSFDPKNPLARLATETARAHKGLLDYAELMEARSLLALSERTGVPLPTAKRWSGQHDWQERVEAYDAILANRRTAEAEKKYLKEIEEHRTKYYSLGQELAEAAVQMLRELVANKDNINYTSASLKHIADALKMSSLLEAHSLGIEALLDERK